MRQICSKKVLQISHFRIRHMFNLTKQYSDAVYLCIDEPDFSTPSFIIEKAYEEVKNGFTHYTPNAGILELREAISEEVKSVFHWTEPRIKGHFVICFLDFLLERILESKLKRTHLSASPQQIRETLNSMNFAEVKIKKSKFFIKTKSDSLGNKILRLLHIKPPKNVTLINELSL